MKRKRTALARRYGRSFASVVAHDITFAEEYIHEHADVVGAGMGAAVGALLSSSGTGSAIGAAIGAMAGGGVGVALKRAHRERVTGAT
jgi:outer membrane lipoprotein SlyB